MPVAHTAALLAHQGGWDEMLMVVVPVAIFGVLLGAANRRARRNQSGLNASGTEAAESSDRSRPDGAPDEPPDNPPAPPRAPPRGPI